MKKRLEQEPELRLLLEDYRAAGRETEHAETPATFESAEPHFLIDDVARRTRRWLAEHAGEVSSPDDTSLRLLVEDFAPAQRFFERNRNARSAPDPEPGPEPNFLIDWDRDPIESKRAARARAASFLVHLFFIVVAAVQPHVEIDRLPTEPEPGREFARISLTPPSPQQLEQLTEQARGEEGEAQRLAVARAPEPVISPEVQLEPTPAPPMQPLAPALEPEPASPPQAEQPEAEPESEAEPELAAARSEVTGEFQVGTQLATEQREPVAVATAAPQEAPQLRLENPRAIMPAPEGRNQVGELKLTRGRESMVEAAIAQRSETGAGRQAVGEGVGASAMGGYSAPSRGNIGSGLELLSDPEGVDFRPYLLQVLNAVRRNWFAVIPESARLGIEKGRVALQFSISRRGDVPKLVIASSSRSQPLDRASVAGVSASLPFPPLPNEFSGDEIRVQFVFLYNVR